MSIKTNTAIFIALSAISFSCLAFTCPDPEILASLPNPIPPSEITFTTPEGIKYKTGVFIRNDPLQFYGVFIGAGHIVCNYLPSFQVVSVDANFTPNGRNWGNGASGSHFTAPQCGYFPRPLTANECPFCFSDSSLSCNSQGGEL